MDGFYGERDVCSYVGNTEFLWKRSILHEKNGAVESGRIRRIKVPTIFRSESEFTPEHLALPGRPKERKEPKASERSEEVTSREQQPEYLRADYAHRSLGCFSTMEDGCALSSLREEKTR